MSQHHATGNDHERDEDQRDTAAPADDLLDVNFNAGPLVDSLSRGEPPQSDDELAVLLAAWRDDLTAGLDTGTATRTTRRLAPVLPFARPERLRGRLFRHATAAAAAAVVLFAGIAIGSYNTSPSSPLWPVTQVLYPEHAQVVAIEQTIAQARRALDAGHTDVAAQLINIARHQLADARLPDAVAARLRTQIDALVLDLAAVVANHTQPTNPAGTPTTRPTPKPSTTTRPPAGAPAPPAPAPSTSNPAPLPSPVEGILPGLPPLLPSPSPNRSSSPTPSPSPSPSSGGGVCLPLLPCLGGSDGQQEADSGIAEPTPDSSQK